MRVALAPLPRAVVHIITAVRDVISARRDIGDHRHLVLKLEVDVPAAPGKVLAATALCPGFAELVVVVNWRAAPAGAGQMALAPAAVGTQRVFDLPDECRIRLSPHSIRGCAGAGEIVEKRGQV